MGLGHADLRAANPRLVYASITAFGQTGPYSGYRWSELVAFAMGGLMYVSGKPSSPPVNAPGAQAFLVGSAHAALAILIALWHVRQGGAGQHIDVSMMDCLAAMENMVSRSASTGVHPRRDGTQHRFATPGTIYRCRDGFVHIFVTNSQPGPGTGSWTGWGGRRRWRAMSSTTRSTVAPTWRRWTGSYPRSWRNSPGKRSTRSCKPATSPAPR